MVKIAITKGNEDATPFASTELLSHKTPRLYSLSWLQNSSDNYPKAGYFIRSSALPSVIPTASVVPTSSVGQQFHPRSDFLVGAESS